MDKEKLFAGLVLTAIGLLFFYNNKNMAKGASKFYAKIYTEKNLTISDVSSPQMSALFVKHSEKLLNLDLNSYAYWVRFTVTASRTEKKWLLFFGWPNTIDEATLYIPKTDDLGWIVKEVGRVLPVGPDPLPSRPADFLPDSRTIQSITIYLRVESSDFKKIPLQILTDESCQRRSKLRLLWFGIYYGIMLAMFLYNLILFVSLRELNRLYYLFYLLSIGVLYPNVAKVGGLQSQGV